MHSTSTLLTSFLEHSAATRADFTALTDPEISLTFAQVRGAAVQIAADLGDRGLGRGDRVVLLMANSVGFALGYWGVLFGGGVAVPLNPAIPTEKLGWILADCTPKVVICDAALTALVRQAADHAGIKVQIVAHGVSDEADMLAVSGDPARVAPSTGVIDQDLAAIIYTSGSTGAPKGVMLSHLNMTSAARSVAQYLGYLSEDRVFCTIPLTFDYGLHQLTMTTLVGANLLIEPSFAQPLFALQRLVKGAATVFPVVPTMVPLIAPLADRFDFSAIRCVTSTSAALHPGAIDQLAKVFWGARLFSMYGLTECHRCTYLDPAQLATRKSSVGKAIPNTELWLVDAQGQTHHRNATGELVIRGSTVMKGYWNNPAKTAEKLRPGPLPDELVLYTGDTCRLDDDGYLYFISRSDDILKVGGEKVAPTEVEAALMRHPAVIEACVLGVDHAVYGQQCVAAVTLKGANPPDARALKDWCATQLEPHSIPARVLVVEAMARNMNGKIDRHVLRAMIEKPSLLPLIPTMPASGVVGADALSETS
ncbi:MAG: class I adenylate-forming enzyme family protein [Paracoccaceae bacterium]